jgi:hypothetical protein
MTYLAIAARCALGLVFLVSAASKLRAAAAFAGFESSIRDMRLLPSAAVRAVALVVVAAEVAVTILLAVPVTATAGLLTAAALVAVFSTAIVLVLRRGGSAVCRCFGSSDTPFGPAHLLRNALLGGTALAGTVGSLAAPTPVQVGGVIVTVMAATMVAFLAITLTDIIALFDPLH